MFLLILQALHCSYFYAPTLIVIFVGERQQPILTRKHLQKAQAFSKFSNSQCNITKLLTSNQRTHHHLIPLGFKLPKFKGNKEEEELEVEEEEEEKEANLPIFAHSFILHMFTRDLRKLNCLSLRNQQLLLKLTRAKWSSRRMSQKRKSNHTCLMSPWKLNLLELHGSLPAVLNPYPKNS